MFFFGSKKVDLPFFLGRKTGAGACAWLPWGHPVEEVVGVWREPPSQVPGKGDPWGSLWLRIHQDEWIFSMEKIWKKMEKSG